MLGQITRKHNRLAWLVGVAALGLSACAVQEKATAPAPAQAPTQADIQAPTPAPTETTAPSFSPEGITALEARMAQYVADGDVYGIATRLVHKGEVISDFKAGLRGLEAGAPIQDDTIYRIYSMTKPITGIAMMMLWEEGAFTLDDPITKYVPEFEGLRVISGTNEDGTPILVDATRPPTVREIMNHTAGFAYGLFGDDVANSAFRNQQILASPDLQTFIDQVADVPLLFQPGEKWSYSAAVDIQGYMIEKLTGQRFGEYLETRIFSPLGMTDTAFFVPEDEYDRLSEVYGYDPETGYLVPIPYPSLQYRASTVKMESGGGGLVSTMDDYARFSQMLINGGELNGVRLIKPETLQLMTTNTLTPSMDLFGDGSANDETISGLGFGLDFGLVINAEAAKGSQPEGAYFWGGAAGTWFWIDPANDLYFIGMVQIFNRGEHAKEFDLRTTSSDLVYEALAD